MEDKTQQDKTSTIEKIVGNEITLEKCLFALSGHSAFTGVLLYGTIENVQKEDYLSAALTVALSLLPIHQIVNSCRYVVRNYSKKENP